MNDTVSLSTFQALHVQTHSSDRFVVAADTNYASHIGSVLESNDEIFCEISIFVSCYNERDHIKDTLDTVVRALSDCNRDYEIIVIDDCSTDNSAEIVSRYIQAHSGLRIALKINGRNLGLGQNFADAIFIARGKYFRHVCGDNVEPYETLHAIFSQTGMADLILPYHVDIVGKSMTRQRISKLYTFVINLLSGNSVKYYNGLPLFRRQDLTRTLPITAGFGFQADIVTRMLSRGATYHEVPVKMIETKASTAISLRNFLSVAHVAIEIVIRRMSDIYHGRRK